MLRRSAATIAALVTFALAGCGAGTVSGKAADPPAPPDEQPVGRCAQDSAAVRGAAKVADADLDGDGTPEPVRRTAPDAKGCGSFLVVTLDGVTTGVPLAATATPAAGRRAGAGAPAERYRVVTVPGRDGQLVAVREQHPRGGYRDHLYLADQGRLAELLTAKGDPPLPFVVTDVQVSHQTVRCAPGRIVLVRAVRHEPPGVIAAWDVRRTTYTIEGHTAATDGEQEIADNVLDRQLPQRYPDVFAGKAFVSCA